MNETLSCPFCEGKKISADPVICAGKITTVAQMIRRWDLLDDHENRKIVDYILFDQKTKTMRFNSSSCEYGDCYVNINYCPICGKKINKEVK